MPQPGLILLLGSGETSPNGGQAFEILARALPQPLKISILETPAGFELNSSQVAGRVANYISLRLQNFHPQVHLIPARQRGTPNSPDNPAVLTPLLDSILIFFGPGSPTYTVRQLSGSLAWEFIRARHRLGAALALASAASIAIGKKALPVYEIYKVGEDPHWKPGLDFFAPFGLSLVIISHWNNHDGGLDVDTSHCFIGRGRFEELHSRMEPETTVVGIDEHTALLIDLAHETCRVIGQDAVHILRGGREQTFREGQSFLIQELGDYKPLEDLQTGIDPAISQIINTPRTIGLDSPPGVPSEIIRLVQRRQEARSAQQWNVADQLRKEIQKLGWSVIDTPQGPILQINPQDEFKLK